MKKQGMITFLTIGAVCLGLSSSPAFAATHTFTDAEEHWAASSISAAVKKGYVDGYPDGTFKPDQNVSRAEFIKMLSEGTGSKPEADKSEWYSGYVKALLKKNVLMEDDFTDYNAPMTRLELARLSLRMVRTDLQKPNVYMGDDTVMYNAVKDGLIQGLSGGELGPSERTTRAQSITIIERVLSKLKGETLPVDKVALSYASVAQSGTNFEAYFKSYPIALPHTIALTEGTDMTINKMILVDMSDPSSAYYDLFKDKRLSTRKELSNHYILAFDLTVTNKVPTKEHIFGDLRRIIRKDAANVLGNGMFLSFNYEDPEPTSGWFAFALDKEETDSIRERRSVFGPSIYVNNKSIDLYRDIK